MNGQADTPKKVLFLITKSNGGGAQQYVYDIATHLPKDRFEAVVAGGGNGILFAKLRDAGIRTVSIAGLQRDVAVRGEWRAFWGILRVLKKERPDIVHLNSPKAAALGAVAALLSAVLQPTVVFTIHGWPFGEDRPLFQRAAIFLISWMTCMLCDRVILINTADYASGKRFLSRKKRVLIQNGLAPIPFFPRERSRSFFEEKIGRKIATDTIVIGAIAELTKNKGLRYLIDAIRLLVLQPTTHKLQTIIIGDGEDRAALEKQIADAGLQSNVFLLGFVPDAARFLHGFDIFVLPSLKEGLPYALMAAMSAGLPAVASRVGGIPDLVTDQKTGFIAEPKDIRGLRQALGRLIASREMRAHMGAAGRKKIETSFSFSAMMHATISLYHDSRTTQ